METNCSSPSPDASIRLGQRSRQPRTLPGAGGPAGAAAPGHPRGGAEPPGWALPGAGGRGESSFLSADANVQICCDFGLVLVGNCADCFPKTIFFLVPLILSVLICSFVLFS